MDGQGGSRLWLRWVAANALAELVGLGSTLAIDYGIIARVAAAKSIMASMVGILLVTISGAIEGGIVGLAQWAVLRSPFPRIARRSWIGATVVGAMVAWFFGSLPSTLMDMGGQQSGGAAQEPSTLIVLLLAAAMGLFLGFILAYPQWRALRQAAEGAWIWLPANCVAWALGMPTIFAAMDIAVRSPTLLGSIAIVALGVLLAGALVGAVHGLALVRLASRARGASVSDARAGG